MIAGEFSPGFGSQVLIVCTASGRAIGRLTPTVRLQTEQERHQILQLVGGVSCGGGVALLAENLLQRGGAAVVEEWPAVGEAAEGGRIELAVALGVRQAHVVRGWRSVSWRGVAACAVAAGDD